MLHRMDSNTPDTRHRAGSESTLIQETRPNSNDSQDPSSLALSRTKSQEFSVAESVAVPTDPPVESIRTSDDDKAEAEATRWPRSVQYLVMLCAFLTSLSFGVTQVPLLYVFRLMTCDAYYDEHPVDNQMGISRSISAATTKSLLSYAADPWAHLGGVQISSSTDPCSVRSIESSTALSIALLGASTTVFGILNLFLTGYLIKRIGVKATLIMQVFFPAIRLLVQNIGVEVWGKLGIMIVQGSQVVVVIGGPSGYLLALNTFITEVVEHEGRTAALGRLGGAMLFGSALGFLLGGLTAEVFGIKAPFRLTFILFLVSCAYVAVFLPYIRPTDPSAAGKKKSSSQQKSRNIIGKFFAPLLVFAPRKAIRRDGIVQTEFGAFLLAIGVFLGILATGYLPTALQLYSTDVFGFGTEDNGWLIFMYSMLRGVFLTFAFPNLIAMGRRWTARREAATEGNNIESRRGEAQPLLSAQKIDPKAFSSDLKGGGNGGDRQRFTFDLIYTRISLIADGVLTLLCMFVQKGWQMYLVAAILPFSAGTGSASKGTILQMVGSDERVDALAGVALVENMARLSTTFIFGIIFSAFASIGRTELVFTCNAIVAITGFLVMLIARFPPEGSRWLDQEDTEEEFASGSNNP